MQEGKDGGQYYFPDDLTDKAVEWLHGVRAQDAAKPWFMYYSTGCAHAPHHVTRTWADKYRGRFDGGWDQLREETFERQKRLGIIPRDAELTERPDLFPAWALTQQQALELAGISPPAVGLTDTDLAATRWAGQAEVDWILLIPSLAATHTQTVIRPVASEQLVPFTLQWNPSRAHTTAVARFVHAALTAELPAGWHTQPDHLRHRG